MDRSARLWRAARTQGADNASHAGTPTAEHTRRYVLMDLGLNSKLALITGSTAGIGLATAEALAREGARVIINGRTPARVQTAVNQLRKAVPGSDVAGAAADLGTAAGCDSVIRAFPEVDVLVNNMGVFEPKPFEEIGDSDWLRFFETNVLSGVRLARHYVRGMRSRNWGRIVFVSSESGLQIPAEMIHYGVTKTAQLARSTGKDTATVEREFFQTARPSSILRRFATTTEVAAMITYVCSSQASATTGAALRVDGGVVRAIA